MARPTKSVGTMNRHLTKDEKRNRLEQEQKLRGAADSIICPDYLNENQTQIFNFIVEELKASGILGNLDIFILTTCAIAIQRLQEIETTINEDSNKLLDKELLSAKRQYTADFFKGIQELSLSPSSRAKIGNINLAKSQEQEDPLLQILKGRKERQ